MELAIENRMTIATIKDCNFFSRNTLFQIVFQAVVLSGKEYQFNQRTCKYTEDIECNLH